MRRRPLRKIVFTALRQAIMRGDLKPGDRLREAQIAEQMGVSRAPVREAIRDLESEGIVVSRTHRGAFVTELTGSDLWEIYTLRAALESMAVEIVTQQASPGLLATLRESIAEMRAAVQEGDIDRLVALDIAFHETLCRRSNHTRLFDIWSSMISQIRACIGLTHTLYLPAEDIIRLHVELVEQVANKEAKAAGQTVARHILEAGALIAQEYQASRGEENSQSYHLLEERTHEPQESDHT